MKILWGPFNHERLDVLIQEQLKDHDLKSFGFNGADELMQIQDAVSDAVRLWQPDVIVLIEPILRLFSPALLKTDIPVIAIGSLMPMDSAFLDLFDGFIYLWNQPQDQNKVSVTSWLPLKLPETFAAQRAKIYALSCTQNLHLSASWRNALNALDCVYVQDLNADNFRRVLEQSHAVFVPDPFVSPFHFEALAAGAYLMYPEEAWAVSKHLAQEPRAIACTPEDLPAIMGDVLKQTLEPIEHIQVKVAELNELLERLLSKKNKRQTPSELRALLFHVWANGPSQEELVFQGFHYSEIKEFVAQQPLLNSWYSESLLEDACYCSMFNRSSELIVPQQEIPTGLIKQLNHEQYQQWKCLSFSLMCYERGVCQQSEQLDAVLIELICLDPRQILDFLQAHPEVISQNLVVSLLEVCPDSLFLRQKRFEYDDDLKQNKAFVTESIELLDKTLAWQEQRLEFLSQCLIKDQTQHKPHILWQGPLDSFGSFQCVNQAILEGFEQSTTLSLSVLCEGLPVTAKKLPELSLPLTLPDLIVSHTYSHSEHMPLPVPWVKILPWEFGMAPIHWVRFMQSEQDEVWVPSQFNKDVYVRSGVAQDKIQVIPNGVDTEVYTPKGPLYSLETEKSFKFLYVGGALHRKGFDILIKAYCEAFGSDDDVCLVIKDFGAKSWYANQTMLGQALKKQTEGTGPEILIITEDNLSDQALASLYRACDVYVHPYRGEGFGMGILEAMSCGTPPIIPAAGPAPEFCPDTCGWQLPVLTHFMPQDSFLHAGIPSDYTALPSFIDEPDLYALKAVMKNVSRQALECQKKGAQARKQALKYDWGICVARVEKRLLSLVRLPEPYRLKKFRLHNLLKDLYISFEQSPPEALRQIQSVYSEFKGFSWELPWLYAQALFTTQQYAQVMSLLEEAFELGLPDAELIKSQIYTELWVKPSVFFASEHNVPVLDVCQQVVQPQSADFVFAGDVPTFLDFSFFKPQVSEPGIPVLLSVIDWTRPYGKQLLHALLQIFAKQSGKVKWLLVSKEAMTPEEAKIKQSIQAQKKNMPHHIEVEFKEWPQDQQAQKDLFNQVRLMLNLDSDADGQPLLIAQAMGIRVVSTDHLPHLEYPYAEVLKVGDVQKMMWILPRLLSDKRTQYDGIAVRSHVKVKYDEPVVRQHVTESVHKAWILSLLKQRI